MAISTKRDAHDIVTAHDRASEAMIAARIRAEVPDSTIVGEEGGRQGAGRVVWYVDPIDGTTNFARGLPAWCVSIAAAIDGEVVAGVVHAPVTGETFRADRSGAWLDGRPLAAPARRARGRGRPPHELPRRPPLRGPRRRRRPRRTASSPRPSSRCATPAAARCSSPGSPPAGPTPRSASAPTPGTSPPAR